MTTRDVVTEYTYSYDQRAPGYSGELPEHWSHREPIFGSKRELLADLARLDAYIAQQAEHYPGEWIRNRTRPKVRSVVIERGYWRELPDGEL
jgi:hypothetical protein